MRSFSPRRRSQPVLGVSGVPKRERGYADIAAEAFEGYIVRKDLARRFQGLYPVPTYVGEFLLGRYCA
jgi:hypothetical protein